LNKPAEVLQGTLDMLILKAVSLGALHGYGVLLRIQQISRDRLEIPQGFLYPALYRLEHQGWIASEWGESENKRKAKYYRLTAAGKRRLLAGIALGLAGAMAVTRLLASELYGVSPTDALTYFSVTGTMAAITLVACYVPTRHALRVDPLTALRQD
jgi:PadR family transcriptional regulator, regulatory protein PadR